MEFKLNLYRWMISPRWGRAVKTAAIRNAGLQPGVAKAFNYGKVLGGLEARRAGRFFGLPFQAMLAVRYQKP
jgi:hypothetical protein